jgi:hypothetical protein
MIKIELNNKTYDLPQSWNEITVERFERIQKHATLINTFKSQTQFAFEMYAFILDAPVEELRMITKSSFDILSEKCTWATGDIKPTKKKRFKIDGEDYIPMEKLDKLTMGDVASLELMIAESSSEEILGNILPILIRPAKKIIKGDKEVEVPGEVDWENYADIKDKMKKNLMVADVINFKDFF